MWGGGARGAEGGGRGAHRERWMCSSFNGYDCRCERLGREQMAALLDIVASAGARAWRPETEGAAWAEVIQRVRAAPRFRALLHGPTFLKSARAAAGLKCRLICLTTPHPPLTARTV